MADISTSADELISELEEAATEVAPVEAVEFVAEARDELAAYREQQNVPRQFERTTEGERFDIRRSGIIVPSRYRDRAEVFVVFETFVRFFLDPVTVAAEIPNLLARVDPEWQINQFAFLRFGEEPPAAVQPPESGVLLEDSADLIAMATRLGSALFGDSFRAEDFWTSAK